MLKVIGKGKSLFLKGLSPWVCEKCGEEAFEPSDVDLMQSLIRGTGESGQTPEIMNIEEVAVLLRVSAQTFKYLARIS